MLSRQNRDKIWIIFGACCVGFAALLVVFPILDLIIVLNSLYAGSLFGIIVAYWRLIIATVAGSPPFDRARQYALGVFILWAAYSGTVLISIYVHASGIATPTYLMIIASRYAAILAAWLQVTAPDFGEGFFAGRDRKVLWIAVALSIAASMVLIIAQDRTVLSS
jgi:hypothetical protein